MLGIPTIDNMILQDRGNKIRPNIEVAASSANMYSNFIVRLQENEPDA